MNTGNGGVVKVVADEVAVGYVRFHTAEGSAEPAKEAAMLDNAVLQWCQQRPHFRGYALLPVVVGGNLIAVHV